VKQVKDAQDLRGGRVFWGKCLVLQELWGAKIYRIVNLLFSVIYKN